MKRFVIAIFGSLLAAVYWWIVFTIVYADALFAGDRNPALQPFSDHDTLTRSGAVIVAGVLVYALLSMVWQRLTVRLRRAG